jgi:hypothetical protein
MTSTAKLFMRGRSQAVLLPEALGARDYLPDGIPDDPPVESDPRVVFDE